MSGACLEHGRPVLHHRPEPGHTGFRLAPFTRTQQLLACIKCHQPQRSAHHVGICRPALLLIAALQKATHAGKAFRVERLPAAVAPPLRNLFAMPCAKVATRSKRLLSSTDCLDG